MADEKREAFRRYLDEGSVVKTLGDAMTALNELADKPADPLNFVRGQIGGNPVENVDALIRENQDLTARAARLKWELEAFDQ